MLMTISKTPGMTSSISTEHPISSAASLTFRERSCDPRTMTDPLDSFMSIGYPGHDPRYGGKNPPDSLVSSSIQISPLTAIHNFNRQRHDRTNSRRGRWCEASYPRRNRPKNEVEWTVTEGGSFMTKKYDELRRFIMPEVMFGPGAIDLVGPCAANLGLNKVLLVTDPGVTDSGWTERAWRSLDEEGVEWTVFSDVSPNPRTSQVTAGVEAYLSGGCDGLIAVGGGSPNGYSQRYRHSRIQRRQHSGLPRGRYGGGSNPTFGMRSDHRRKLRRCLPVRHHQRRKRGSQGCHSQQGDSSRHRPGGLSDTVHHGPIPHGLHRLRRPNPRYGGLRLDGKLGSNRPSRLGRCGSHISPSP